MAAVVDRSRGFLFQFDCLQWNEEVCFWYCFSTLNGVCVCVCTFPIVVLLSQILAYEN